MNNRLSVQTWRNSECAGVSDSNGEPKRDAVKLKTL